MDKKSIWKSIGEDRNTNTIIVWNKDASFINANIQIYERKIKKINGRENRFCCNLGRWE